jgi:hypothetical protein
MACDESRRFAGNTGPALLNLCHHLAAISDQMMIGVAERGIDHGQPLEVVTHRRVRLELRLPQVRTLRLAGGPDELHRKQIGKMELGRYVSADAMKAFITSRK